jgi:chemotaxis-related protein WspB
VVEVICCVNLERLPEAPDWLAGISAYRGRAVPVADLTRLTAGQPCPRRWNSRIIVARFELEDVPTRVGLLAERVTTAEIELQAGAASADQSGGMSTFGRILMDDEGIYQLLEPSLLLSADRRRALQSFVSESRR